MKFIKICRDGYIRVDRITVLEVVENGEEFAIGITLDGDTRLTLEPFSTRDEASKRLEEIVAEISKEDEYETNQISRTRQSHR